MCSEPGRSRGRIAWGITAQFNSALTTVWITCTKLTWDYKRPSFFHTIRKNNKHVCLLQLLWATDIFSSNVKHRRFDHVKGISHLAGEACRGKNTSGMYSSHRCQIYSAAYMFIGDTHPWKKEGNRKQTCNTWICRDFTALFPSTPSFSRQSWSGPHSRSRMRRHKARISNLIHLKRRHIPCPGWLL